MDNEKPKSEELAVFWAQTQPAIAGFIYSLVSNFQDADDILQNVAVITVEKFSEFDRSKSFIAWANGIAKYLILKYYSQRRKTQIALDEQAIQAIAEVYEKEFSRIEHQKEQQRTALQKCLGLLKGKWKTILEMHYLRELSTSRIAQQLGMTQSNVFVSLHRARVSLRDCVNKQLQGGGL